MKIYWYCVLDQAENPIGHRIQLEVLMTQLIKVMSQGQLSEDNFGRVHNLSIQNNV